MFRLTIANLARRKLRLLATSLAVLLGVMFTSGTLVLTDSLQSTFDELFSDVYANTSAVVRSDQKIEGGLEVMASGPVRNTMPESLVDEIARASGVATASGNVQGYTHIIKRDGKALGNPNQGPPVMGSGWPADPMVSPYQLTEGRAPTGADEIVTDVSSADKAGWAIGDDVPLLTPTGSTTKTLVGLTTFGDADSAGGATMVQYTLAEAQRIFDREGRLDEIWVRAEPGVSEADAVRAIEALDLTDVEVLTGTAASQEAKDLATSFLSFITIFLLVFAIIALLVGGFIIANTFSILVAQRTRELALLRAIGASRRQVLASVVGEAGAVGIIASAVGLFAGYGIASALYGTIMSAASNAPSTRLTTRTIVASFVIGIGITVVSAILPARRAARVAPVAAMRESTIEANPRGRLRAIIGAVLVAIAVVGIVAGVTTKVAQWIGLAAGAGLIGAVVLGPTLATAFAAVVRRPLRSRGMAAHLGVENVLRNPRRTASTASALMIGATLVCAISVFASSALTSIDRLVSTGFHGEVIITSSGNGVPLADIAEMADAPGVASLVAMRYGPVTIDGDGMIVSAADPAALDAIVDMQVTSGDLASMGDGDVAIAASLAKERGWEVGTTLPATLLDGTERTLTVKATFTNPLVGRRVFTSPDTIAGSLIIPVSQIAFAKAEPGVSADVLTARLAKIAEGNPTTEVQTNAEFRRTAAQQMDTFLNIIYVMLALAVIIAVIGIVNTLGLSIIERTRELGLLRAVGMTRRQLRSTIRIEGLLIALTGTIIGLVLGTALGAGLINSFGPEQALSGLTIPWIRLGVVLVIGVAVGLIASVLPARRAVRMDPLDALAAE